MAEDFLVQVSTPLGFEVRGMGRFWERIATAKHPNMEGRLDAVVEVIRNPEEVRRSRRDQHVVLFYRVDRPGRWLCAVIKRPNGEGFLITSYVTSTRRLKYSSGWRRIG